MYPLGTMPSPHKSQADSPALDAFLRGHQLRRLQGTELKNAVRKMFEDGDPARFKDDRPAFDFETKPLRIMVMWRITRAMAMVTGICAEDETLDAATEIHPNPWVVAFKPSSEETAGVLRRQRAASVLRQFALGLTLMPPRDDIKATERWCNAAAMIAKDFGIERNDDGMLGLNGLLDPESCAQCDVRIDEILAFEEMLLQETLDMLLDKGERATIKYFKETNGFSHKESANLMRVVKTQALERSNASIEEKRALQEMRLEDYIGRSKETMDMDGEMKGIKELAKIQGLTRTEPENQTAEFFEVIKSVASRQDRELLDPRTLALLNGRRDENVEPRTIELAPEPQDEDDEEALAEYDKENQHR